MEIPWVLSLFMCSRISLFWSMRIVFLSLKLVVGHSRAIGIPGNVHFGHAFTDLHVLRIDAFGFGLHFELELVKTFGAIRKEL